ncbi:unnamed protein product [Rotaria sordida]|uniref:Uncharacterized protein n=1 Tax=Rotaria sordida TaxID=392033 RepID=A0A814MN23_9BILA|nr:unnamed protein product [Rotaria sordida]
MPPNKIFIPDEEIKIDENIVEEIDDFLGGDASPVLMYNGEGVMLGEDHHRVDFDFVDENDGEEETEETENNQRTSSWLDVEDTHPHQLFHVQNQHAHLEEQISGPQPMGVVKIKNIMKD